MAEFPKEVVCAISKTSDGNMDFRFGEAQTVIRNRTGFLKRYGILYEDHIAMRCDHTDIISLVTSFHPEVGAYSQEEQIHSEVLVTQEKNLALMLFTADCQPTCFYDPVTETIALAHISRKTLCNKLSEKTVAFLQESFGVEAENLLVHIGPSIQKESYAFPLPLEEVDEQLQNFVEEREGMAYIDLLGAHKKQLQGLGVKKENINASEEDTASDAYFSYHCARKKGESDAGRMATILMLT